MGDDARVVQAARVSTAREDKVTGSKKLIKYLLKNGHWSPFEHVTFTFRSEIPIFIARQLMRHKSQSFNEFSMRYSEAKPEFYFTGEYRSQSTTNKQGSGELVYPDPYLDLLRTHTKILYEDAWELYEELLQFYVAREQAREVLPVSVYTTLYTTANLRSLLHFLGDREASDAQLEIQRYANQVRELIAPIVPITLEAWEEVQSG